MKMPDVDQERMLSFGEKVRQIRRSKGWSQDEFAAKIGVHGRHIGKYEHGKVLPNGETLIRMADVLDVSMDYLLRNGDANPAARIQDKELIRDFELVDQMEADDKKTVKTLIDAFIKRKQMEKLITA